VSAPAVAMPLPDLRRAALVPTVLAHAVAAAALVSGWSSFRSGPAAAALLVASAALVGVLAQAAPPCRRPGARPYLVAAGALAVSVALPLLLPAAQRAPVTCWNWATGATILLAIAVHLPPAPAVALAVAHGVVAVTVTAGLGGTGWATGTAGGGAWTVTHATVVAVLPALAGAQYGYFHRHLTEGPPAVARRRAAPTSAVPRLEVLGRRIEPLLRDVAEGCPLPLDVDRATSARQFAEELRQALAASRRALWLPEQVGGAPVQVVGTDAATRGAADGDRIWLAALLDLLGTRSGWRHVRVVLDLRLDGSVTGVVTADGAAAPEAARDPRVQALCEARGARCDADDELLVIEAAFPSTIGA